MWLKHQRPWGHSQPGSLSTGMKLSVLFFSLQIKVILDLRSYTAHEILLLYSISGIKVHHQKWQAQVRGGLDWGTNVWLTFASSMALEGIKIRGKAYIAPWRGLQWIPGILLNMSSVSLAFLARLFKTDSFSCLKGRCSAGHIWSGNKNTRRNYEVSKALPQMKHW